MKPAALFLIFKHLVGLRNTNIALDFHLRRGDVAKALAEADDVFEHTFRTQQVMLLLRWSRWFPSVSQAATT